MYSRVISITVEQYTPVSGQLHAQTNELQSPVERRLGCLRPSALAGNTDSSSIFQH